MIATHGGAMMRAYPVLPGPGNVLWSLGSIQGAIRRYFCRRSVPRAGAPPNRIFSTSRIALPPLKTITLPVDSLTVTAVAFVTAVIPAAA